MEELVEKEDILYLEEYQKNFDKLNCYAHDDNRVINYMKCIY